MPFSRCRDDSRSWLACDLVVYIALRSGAIDNACSDRNGHPAHLQLCLHFDLIVQLCLETVFCPLPVLADKDKNGEKNSFERDRHGEKLIGIRVKMGNNLSYRVPDDPEGKRKRVEEQKGDRSTEVSNNVCYALSQRELFLFSFVGILACRVRRISSVRLRRSASSVSTSRLALVADGENQRIPPVPIQG